MSIIEGFVKIWPFVHRYRGRVAVSMGFAFLVGVFWGSNLSLVFPVSSVLMQGNLQDYVARQLKEAQDTAQQAEARIAAIDLELQAPDLSESRRLKLLDTRSNRQDHLALATRQIHWLIWSQTTILPWIPVDQFNTIALFFAILLVATIIKGACLFMQNLIVGSLIELVTIDVRKAMFRKCLSLDYQTLSLEGTPALMSRFSFDVRELATGIELVGGKMSREPLKALVCVGLAFAVNWRLTLLSVLFAPVALLLFYRLGKLLKTYSHRLMESASHVYQVLEEALTAMRVIIPYENKRRHRAHFHKVNREYYRKAMKICMVDSFSHPIVEVVGIASIFATVLPCMYLLLRKTTSIYGIQLADKPPDVPTLIMLYTFLVGTIDPARKLSSVYSKLKRSVAAIDRIDQFLRTETRVLNAPNAERMTCRRHSQRIEFENIRFAYAQNDNRPRRDALNQVSLSVEFGECVLVVGSNGSGKSTLVNLLPRYYDPDRGRVLVDGVDIRQMGLRDWRQQLAVVTQETFLFNESILDNIRYGNPNCSRFEIERAASLAGVTHFVDQLPDGFETVIGERGGALSGGQRQRIALARALVRNPSILILDEATSAIDAQTELFIQQALKKLTATCTIFIITHTVSRTLLELATRVVVMHEGTLVATGQHADLLATCPEYQRLYQAQVHQLAG